MTLDWNIMAPFTTSRGPTDLSSLWTYPSDLALMQWTKEQCPEQSSSYQFPDVLGFPDLQGSLGDKPSPPELPTTPSSDEVIEDKGQKRREQNRNAQRAFRERKEKYIKSLLQRIDEMNKNHTRLAELYNSVRQEALDLQDQVQNLKRQLEFWHKAQIVMVKVPENVMGGADVDALQSLLAGLQHTQRPLNWY